MAHPGMYERDLERLAEENGVRIEVVADKAEVHRRFARDVADFIKSRNAQGQETALILPVGPVKQYPILAEICNAEGISWKRIHAFFMDEYLDWQGRWIDEDHPLSFRGFVKKRFFALLNEQLRIPEANIHFPDPLNIDAYSEKIRQLGGIDCCYGGIGVHGHVAFNEPIGNLFYRVSVEEFKQSKTRVLTLNKETVVMNATRAAGGRLNDFPPMAVTVGMADILASRRIRLYCDGGEWQKAAVRHAIAGEPSVAYPVSLLRGHPDYGICMDAETAAPAHFHL